MKLSLKERKAKITTFSRRSRMVPSGKMVYYFFFVFFWGGGGGGISLRTKIWVKFPVHLSQFQLLHSLYRFSWNQNLTGWINVHRNITWPISFLEKVANSKGIHNNSGKFRLVKQFTQILDQMCWWKTGTCCEEPIYINSIKSRSSAAAWNSHEGVETKNCQLKNSTLWPILTMWCAKTERCQTFQESFWFWEILMSPRYIWWFFLWWFLDVPPEERIYCRWYMVILDVAAAHFGHYDD